MKKLFRLLMSVVAVAGTLACTTDATEDLGVKVGGKTQLTLSLDNTRTQLGEKNGDTYPLTWAAGDQISVNGVASDPLATEDGAGTANATFTFGGALTTPYFIAYPAADAANQVKFAATQYYSSNTSFESGVATMYGRSEDGKSVKLNHLTGVLKIGIKGEATIVSACISTVDRKPIAGTFDAKYDTESGKFVFTPAETSEVITYYFDQYGDGLNLSIAEGTTYIYVAVPVVNDVVYNELYVTLTDKDGGVMYATVKAPATKPLKAGAVREFSEDITYAAIDTDNMFVIHDQMSLNSFKTALEEAEDTLVKADATDDEKAEAEATLKKNAVLVNDITLCPLKDLEHKAINAPNYTGEFNGNGYAIIHDPVYAEDNMLTEPLFNSVAATIKGVHLRGVNLISSESLNVGSLVNTYKGSSITHCSAAGKINLSVSSENINIIGGLVGLTDYIDGDMTLADCVNNCEIAVNISNNGSQYLRIGGLFGFVQKTKLGAGETKSQESTLHKLTMSNLTNNKPIKVIGGGSAGNMYIGGIAASVGGLYVATLTNLHNKADMTVEVDAAKPIRLAGIIAEKYNDSGNRYYHFTAKDCTNSGNIKATVKTTSTGTSNTTIAGLFGQLYDEEEGKSTLTNCDNSGNIEFYGTPTATNLTVRVDIGGVVGIAAGRVNITNCDNTGEKVYANVGTQDKYITMGGISGRTATLSTNNVTSSSNLVTYVTCTNKANVSCYVAKSKNVMAIGGITGEWYCSGSSTKYRLTMSGCVNEGNLLSSCDDIEGSDSRTLIGFIGSTWPGGTSTKLNYKDIQKFEIANCRNGKADKSNTMTITGKKHRHINAGGLMGYCFCHFTIDKCTNNMSYIYNSNATTADHYYGGLYGRMYQTYPYETKAKDSNDVGTVKLWFNVKDFTNNGNASLNVTSEKNLYASKLIGTAEGPTVFLKLGKVTCNGDLTITKKGASATYTNLKVGGVNAYMNSGANTLYDTSEATIAINGNLTVTGLTPNTNATTNIGGAVGSFTKDLSNITVNGTMTVDEGVAAGMLAGTASTTEFTFTNCKVGGKFVEGTTETTLTAGNLATYLFSDRVLTAYEGATLLE